MRLVAVFLCGLGLMAAPGDISALRVVGSTSTVTDSTSACNSAEACNGWVLEVDVTGLATGGTYSLGIGTRNNTTTAKVYCDVTSPGYTQAAAATTIVRRIYATKPLRKVYDAAYSAPYPASETSGSGMVTLRLALSDAVYSGDTLACSIGAGLYTSGGTASSAWAGSATNASTLAHSLSKVLANWSWPHWQRINISLAGDGLNNADGSITLRAVAYHRAAQNAKPVAAVVFSVTDGTTTVTSTATAMSVDTTIGDANKVVEYAGTISAAQLATLTQGATLTANFAAYPWVGDSTAVLNTADGVNTQPTPLYAPRTLLLDRTGEYGTSAAVVDAVAGNDTTCAAVKESVFNSASPPVACATINRAALLIRNLNAAATPTGFGRGDAAGTIYLQAGNHPWTGASNFITGTANTWTTIRPFPGVAKSAAVINAVSGNQHLGTGTKIKLQGVTVNVATAPTQVFASSSAYLWLDDCDLTSNATSATIQAASFYVTRSTIRACRTCLQTLSVSHPALARGNTVTSDYLSSLTMFTVLGNAISGNSSVSFGSTLTASPTTATTTAPIVAYNSLLASSVTSTSPLAYISTAGSPLGAAIIQNVFEYISSVSTALVRIAADGSTVSPVRNILLWHNTLSGQRINRAYNDAGSSLYLRHLWQEAGNLYECAAIKADTFAPTSAARVGNWAMLYGVGNYGNMDVEAGTVANPVGTSGLWQHEFPGLYSDWGQVAASNDAQTTTQAPTTTMRPVNYAQFTSRRSWDGITAGAGGGDYRLRSGSPAISLIPAGQAVLPFDLDGYPRRNDGVGAAGAYEIRSLSRPRTRIVQ